ncbi:hypothetical protein Fcan01_20235 [Folsomia candida]|uniref:Uncharacterized protein n=1 Tax=Folsomia candida TaxID=158441 RepID=A0A226DJY3_FOLCA|nr:hypothetical protein Fcan01_20235 [Folsomia candida]
MSMFRDCKIIPRSGYGIRFVVEKCIQAFEVWMTVQLIISLDGMIVHTALFNVLMVTFASLIFSSSQKTLTSLGDSNPSGFHAAGILINGVQEGLGIAKTAQSDPFILGFNTEKFIWMN